MGRSTHGQLIVSKDRSSWTATLSEDMTWSCDNEYLQEYLAQLSVLYRRLVVRGTMQATKRDLEYRGYKVALNQSHDSVVADIVTMNGDVRKFWSSSHGWAPTNAAELLAKSRLDWQVSLSHCLGIWLQHPTDEDHDGRLILAWVNLGSLLEGTLKFFLSVYESDYSKTPRTRGTRRAPQRIDELQLEDTKQFFKEHIWTDSERRWSEWISKIQHRRNAVHAYRHRDIGTFDEFVNETATYLDLLMDLKGRVPEP